MRKLGIGALVSPIVLAAFSLHLSLARVPPTTLVRTIRHGDISEESFLARTVDPGGAGGVLVPSVPSTEEHSFRKRSVNESQYEEILNEHHEDAKNKSAETEPHPWREMIIFSCCAAFAGILVVVVSKLGEMWGRNLIKSADGLEGKVADARTRARQLAEELEEALRREEVTDQPSDTADAADNPEDAGAAAELVQLKKLQDEKRAIEARIAAVNDLSYDELMGSMLQASEETDIMILKGVENLKNKTAHIWKPAILAQQTMLEEVMSIRSRGFEFAMTEAINMAMKLEQAMNESDDALLGDGGSQRRASIKRLSRTDLQGQTGRFSEGISALHQKVKTLFDDPEEEARLFPEETLRREVETPVASLLISGIFAPLMLKWVKGGAESTLAYNGIMLGMALGIFIADFQKTCGDPLVKVWLVNVCLFNGGLVVSSAILRASSSNALEVIKSEKEAVDVVPEVGNPLLDALHDLEASVSVLMRGAAAYNIVATSSANMACRFSTLFLMLNGFFGFYCACANIETHYSTCPPSLIRMLHIGAFFFVVTLLFTVVSLVIWIISTVLQYSIGLRQVVVSLGISWDKSHFFGKLPIAVPLIRAFLVQDNRDYLAVKKAVSDARLAEIKKEVSESKAKLEQQKQRLAQITRDREVEEEMEKMQLELYRAKAAKWVRKKMTFKRAVRLVIDASRRAETTRASQEAASSFSAPRPSQSTASSSGYRAPQARGSLSRTLVVSPEIDVEVPEAVNR